MKQPAKNPCGSCPYRRDAPSGLWAADEYQKLPAYDRPTTEQPTSVFLCHQQDGRICAGWAGTHDMEESFGLRIALSMGSLPAEDYAATVDFATSVPLFDSGQEAMEHGLRDLSDPSPRARRDAARLIRKEGITHDRDRDPRR